MGCAYDLYSFNSNRPTPLRCLSAKPSIFIGFSLQRCLHLEHTYADQSTQIHKKKTHTEINLPKLTYKFPLPFLHRPTYNMTAHSQHVWFEGPHPHKKKKRNEFGNSIDGAAILYSERAVKIDFEALFVQFFFSLFSRMYSTHMETGVGIFPYAAVSV